ncbi:MAG: adenylate kinase [Verrucomicrobiota bacterium]
MNISLIGPSGAGKGTHAEALTARYNLVHISTGDLLRSNLENSTALGLLARKYMEQGELVPDEVVDAMVEEWLRKTDPKDGILFDGFPRTIYQAKFLDLALDQQGRRLEAVVYLKAPDEEITRRLSGRLLCRNCHAPFHETLKPPARKGICDACGGELYRRTDDEPKMVQARLRVFQRVTGPLLDYYRAGERLSVIDATGSVEEVQKSIARVIESSGRVTIGEAYDTRFITPAVPAPKPVLPPRVGLDLVLLGGPGSGKGTQADYLSRELKLPHVATGDLFRENLKNATDLGKLAKSYMNRGELVPDEITETMVKERLALPDAQGGFILDGFPRTLPQAAALDEILTGLHRRLAGVIYINVSDDEIVARLSGRLICRQCQNPYHVRFKPPAKPGKCDACGGELYQRDDDNPNTVRARLRTFHAQTEPLIDFYRRAGLLVEIPGEGDVNGVAARALETAKKMAAA